jgi:hypothetical protein
MPVRPKYILFKSDREKWNTFHAQYTFLWAHIFKTDTKKKEANAPDLLHSAYIS